MSDWTPDIARLRAFDGEEWLRLERNYCGRLLAYIARRVPDKTAREDIVQETFLGAVRGIELYDPVYSFEQFLFGICRNRTIDHQRRLKTATLVEKNDDDSPAIEQLAREDETPSRIARRRDLSEAGTRALQDVLRAWVQETWEQGEFVRLAVVEALFAGWRNRDTWERFGLRDETSVAGVKFRALKRLREIALERDEHRTVVPQITQAVDSGDALDIDVGLAWASGRVSCPARHWLARLVAGTLSEGPTGFVGFHVDEMRCAWCRANLDDLTEREAQADIEPLLEMVGASTIRYLRSRTLPST